MTRDLRAAVTTVALALAAATAFAVGCGGPSGEAGGGSDARPVVVALVPVIYSLAANVAGDSVRLENLLTPGSSPPTR